MTKAYVLIETAVGRSREVVASLKQMEGIVAVDLVTGPFDLVAVVEASSLAGVGDIVTAKLHPIPGINRTVTCLVM